MPRQSDGMLCNIEFTRIFIATRNSLERFRDKKADVRVVSESRRVRILMTHPNGFNTTVHCLAASDA